jgi:enoyl-CoA hydratase
MGYSCFDVASTGTDGRVAHLQLNRPDAFNSMTREFWGELPEIVHGLDADGRTRAIVLSSTGKHFSAGMDLAVFTGGGGVGADAESSGRSTEAGRRRAQLRQTAMRLQNSFTSLEQVRMPVLAAIQGGCIGGAVDMVTACDLRYASRDAFFCVQEINIGMTADVGTLQRLPKVVPEGVAREMAYRGQRLPAERAYQVGLVQELFDDHDALVAGVLAIADEIAGKSPLAIWGTKEMLNYSRDHSVADGLNYIATWQTGMFQPADMMETFAAKGEKREPVFDDLLPPPDGI